MNLYRPKNCIYDFPTNQSDAGPVVGFFLAVSLSYPLFSIDNTTINSNFSDYDSNQTRS